MVQDEYIEKHIYLDRDIVKDFKVNDKNNYVDVVYFIVVTVD